MNNIEPLPILTADQLVALPVDEQVDYIWSTVDKGYRFAPFQRTITSWHYNQLSDVKKRMFRQDPASYRYIRIA